MYFHNLLFSVFDAAAGQWLKPETSVATLAALCVLTVTSTWNRKAISSLRASCTVRFTLEPEWGHQRATIWSPHFPLPRSLPSQTSPLRSCIGFSFLLPFVYVCAKITSAVWSLLISKSDFAADNRTLCGGHHCKSHYKPFSNLLVKSFVCSVKGICVSRRPCWHV